MDRKPGPTNRQVISGRAGEWIDGELDSAVYFSIARRRAHEAARREVMARLERTAPGFVSPFSPDAGDSGDTNPGEAPENDD